jgi:hypothetical protein
VPADQFRERTLVAVAQDAGEQLAVGQLGVRQAGGPAEVPAQGGRRIGRLRGVTVGVGRPVPP